MADDVNNEPQVTPTPPAPNSDGQSPTLPAAPEPQAPKAPEEEGPKSVPFEQYDNLRKALRQERMKYRQQMQKGLNNSGGAPQPRRSEDGQIDPDYVQSLEHQVALNQLKEQTKELLRDYPDIPQHLKRAIIRNPQGFAKNTSRSIDAVLLDIQDYVEEEMESGAPQAPSTPKKVVQVAGSERPAGAPGVTPADVQSILKKPVDEWTPDDRKRLKEFRESHT